MTTQTLTYERTKAQQQPRCRHCNGTGRTMSVHPVRGTVSERLCGHCQPRRAVVTGAVNGAPAIFQLATGDWQRVESINAKGERYTAILADGSRVHITPQTASFLKSIGKVADYWSAGCWRNWKFGGGAS